MTEVEKLVKDLKDDYETRYAGNDEKDLRYKEWKQKCQKYCDSKGFTLLATDTNSCVFRNNETSQIQHLYKNDYEYFCER